MILGVYKGTKILFDLEVGDRGTFSCSQCLTWSHAGYFLPASVPNSPGATSHLGQAFDFIPCGARFSIWSAIHADKIGKPPLRTFQSAQSIGMPSRAVSYKVLIIRSNTAGSASVLIFLRRSSAEEDFENLGGMGNSARRRTAIDPGVWRLVARRFPIVI